MATAAMVAMVMSMVGMVGVVGTKQKKKTVKSSIECYVSSIGDRIGKEQGFYTSETTLETSAQLKRRIIN